MSMIWYFFLKLNDKINCAHILVGSYDLLDRRINDVTINNILVVFFIIHSNEDSMLPLVCTVKDHSAPLGCATCAITFFCDLLLLTRGTVCRIYFLL